jgi:16S rRNA processing protein RimM
MPRELIIVAEIIRPHGIRGDVVLRPLTDNPETITEAAHLYLGLEAGSPTAVEKVRIHKGAPLLKLAGINSIEDAEKIKGKPLCLPVDELAPLEEGEYFLHDLAGLQVKDVSGNLVGTVDWIMDTGGSPVLMIPAPRGGEMMVPFSSGTIEGVDLEKGVITMADLPGLPIMPGDDSGEKG